MKVKQQPGKVWAATFGTIVVHGILLARQMYGCRGFNQRLPLTEVQILQALDVLGNQTVTGGEEFNVQNVIHVLYEVSLLKVNVKVFKCYRKMDNRH